MMDFVLKMMDFALKMMDFVLKMMDFALKGEGGGSHRGDETEEARPWESFRAGRWWI